MRQPMGRMSNACMPAESEIDWIFLKFTTTDRTSALLTNSLDSTRASRREERSLKSQVTSHARLETLILPTFTFIDPFLWRETEKREVTPGSFIFCSLLMWRTKTDLLLQFAAANHSNKESNPSSTATKSQLLCHQLNLQQWSSLLPLFLSALPPPSLPLRRLDTTLLLSPPSQKLILSPRVRRSSLKPRL